DNCHERRTSVVPRVEGASGCERDFHRREIPIAHRIADGGDRRTRLESSLAGDVRRRRTAKRIWEHGGGVSHTRHAADVRKQPTHAFASRGRIAVPIARKEDSRFDHTIGMKSKLDRLQMSYRASHEAGAEQQHDGERELAPDERLSNPRSNRATRPVPGAKRRTARALISAKKCERRHKSAENAGHRAER